MDFIMKLSKSEIISTDISYYSILIIVNKLTKYTYFISYIKTFEVK